MRRSLLVALALAGVAYLCLSGWFTRASIDYGVLGWIGVGLLVLGGMYGAAQAHARRNWAEYQHYRRQVPVARRAFIGSARTVAGWALAIAAVAVLYLIGRR